MISLSLPFLRRKELPKRCAYCRAFKPLPDAEHVGYCAYWKKRVFVNDCCRKFER